MHHLLTVASNCSRWRVGRSRTVRKAGAIANVAGERATAIPVLRCCRLIDGHQTARFSGGRGSDGTERSSSSRQPVESVPPRPPIAPANRSADSKRPAPPGTARQVASRMSTLHQTTPCQEFRPPPAHPRRPHCPVGRGAAQAAGLCSRVTFRPRRSSHRTIATASAERPRWMPP